MNTEASISIYYAAHMSSFVASFRSGQKGSNRNGDTPEKALDSLAAQMLSGKHRDTFLLALDALPHDAIAKAWEEYRQAMERREQTRQLEERRGEWEVLTASTIRQEMLSSLNGVLSGGI